MTSKRLAVATLILLIAGSCSSDSSEEGAPDVTAAVTTTSEAAESEPTAAPSTTEAAESEPTAAPSTTEAAPSTTSQVAPVESSLPDTPATASFDQAYTFQQGIPEAEKLPAQVGTVEARWFRTPDVFAVVYIGLDAGVDACPGNSALTATGFEFVSNAPLPAGACDDFPTLIDNSSSQGVQICDGVVGYLTLIPSNTVGSFFASIEKPDPDVLGVGLASSVDIPDAGAVPEIDPAALSC